MHFQCIVVEFPGLTRLKVARRGLLATKSPHLLARSYKVGKMKGHSLTDVSKHIKQKFSQCLINPAFSLTL